MAWEDWEIKHMKEIENCAIEWNKYNNLPLRPFWVKHNIQNLSPSISKAMKNYKYNIYFDHGIVDIVHVVHYKVKN